MKEKTKWDDYDALPLILDVTDIQHIMGISRASAYELVHTPGFPAVRSGRLIKISKKAFFNWLDSGGTPHENEKRKDGVIMNLSIQEKKILYAFACPNHHNTVTRLKWLTALTADPKAKRWMLGLARKMENEVEEHWYPCFYQQLRMEMAKYYEAKKYLRMVEKSTDFEEDFMAKLSKYEKETIINWNEAENTASIYTFNADLKRRLTEFSRKYPQLCWLERSTTEGCVTYVMEKSRLSVRLVPPYSEERLAAAREYAKQHGFQVLRTEKESA